jgi:hypothetical protein
MTAPQWQENIDAMNTAQGAKTDASVTDPTASASEIALLKGIISQLQNGGTSGTQYTDGTVAPAHPIGTEIAFNNGGTMTAVSAAAPLPITGSISATNPSVGTDGAAIPTSSTLLGGSDGTNLQPLQVDGSKNLKVTASSLPLPTGASTSAKQPALGTAGTASTDVLSVQGIASMTPLAVTASAGTNLNTSSLALEAGHLATIDTVQGATADAAVVVSKATRPYKDT